MNEARAAHAELALVQQQLKLGRKGKFGAKLEESQAGTAAYDRAFEKVRSVIAELGIDGLMTGEAKYNPETGRS